MVGWRKELAKGLFLLGGLARDQGQPGHACPAKEVLFQYRNMCQSTNVASLASVVQGNLTMAEKRRQSARTESIDSVEVDDLENLAIPEMIMLSAVCGRSDKTILMPWVMFLWESYCQCLQLPRTNSRVERL